jgi:hypothetical protein
MIFAVFYASQEGGFRFELSKLVNILQKSHHIPYCKYIFYGITFNFQLIRTTFVNLILKIIKSKYEHRRAK